PLLSSRRRRSRDRRPRPPLFPYPTLFRSPRDHARRDRRIEPREAGDRLALRAARGEQDDLVRFAQSARAQADALGRRLRRSAHTDRVRRVVAESLGPPGKEARDVAVLADAEQRRVEAADPRELSRIRLGPTPGAEPARDRTQ